MTETLYTFTITGPSVTLSTRVVQADITAAFWGDEVPEPLTIDDITGLVECFPENSPVTWDYEYGFGTFTTRVEVGDETCKLGCYIELVTAPDGLTP
jgi:hypothetical protein